MVERYFFKKWSKNIRYNGYKEKKIGSSIKLQEYDFKNCLIGWIFIALLYIKIIFS